QWRAMTSLSACSDGGWAVADMTESPSPRILWMRSVVENLPQVRCDLVRIFCPADRIANRYAAGACGYSRSQGSSTDAANGESGERGFFDCRTQERQAREFVELLGGAAEGRPNAHITSPVQDG